MRTTVLLGCLLLLCGIAAGQDSEPDPIPGLIEQLSDPDFEVREAASQALIGLGEAAVEALEAACSAEDPEVSWRAESALSAIRAQQEREQAAPQTFQRLQVAPRAAAEFRIELRLGDGEGMQIKTVDGKETTFTLVDGAWVEEGTVVDLPYLTAAPSDMLRAHLGLSTDEGLAFAAENEGLERFGLAPFDVVLSLDGAPVRVLADLEPLFQAEDGASFELELIRRGQRQLEKVILPMLEPTTSDD